jgi:ectoine hydroxylase-related dioxygenase (phytanoyl-CoA dioxygenase family)
MNLLLKNAIKNLKTNGYHVIENFFDQNEILKLKKNSDKFLSKKNSQIPYHVNTSFLKSRNLFLGTSNKKVEKNFSLIIKNKFISMVAKNYLKKNYIPSKLMIYKSIGKKNNLFVNNSKYAFVPHTDETYFLKFFIYLTDVKKEHGPLNVVPRSHLKFKKRRHKWIKNNKDYLKREKVNYNYEDKMKALIAKKGSLIIFDTDILHKAGIAKSNKIRKVIRFDFYSFDENYNTFKKKLYLRLKNLFNFN